MDFVYNYQVIKQIAVDDESYRYREIMGEDMLVLRFSLPYFYEFPVGCYCVFEEEKYTLRTPLTVTKQHNRMYEYVLTMHSDAYIARITMFRDVAVSYNQGAISAVGGSGLMIFPFTGTPLEHLRKVVDNMNIAAGSEVWSVGDCIDYDGVTDSGIANYINYDSVKCDQALALMAEKFNTEYHIVGHTISLIKLQYAKDAPLPMSYGRGNGFRSGVGRRNASDLPPVQRLYVQGGSRNIDPSTYGKDITIGGHTIHVSDVPSSVLLLPYNARVWYDGSQFYTQEHTGAVKYAVSADRRSVVREVELQSDGLVESSYNATERYPSRTGEVTGVVVVDASLNEYDIVDNTIPATLDYNDCLIGGETMTVVFQTGQLAGREFDVTYHHLAEGQQAARRFELKPAQMDGVWMPGTGWLPAVGDKYVVFGCQLPQAYFDDGGTSGAEWEMLRAAIRYMYEQEVYEYTFTGEMDGIWSRQHWNTEYEIGDITLDDGICEYMHLGYHIMFTDAFMPDGILLRITAIKDFINNPYSPILTLSNAIVELGMGTALLGGTGGAVNRNNMEREQRRMARMVSKDDYAPDRAEFVAAINALVDRVNDDRTFFDRLQAAISTFNAAQTQAQGNTINFSTCIEIEETTNSGNGFDIGVSIGEPDDCKIIPELEPIE